MRESWDDYFMSIATKVSTRATCDRLHVGCVLVKDRRIISTGYNGSIPGTPHCDDAGHLMENNHCIRTIHAEVNAVAAAAHQGISTEGATAYLTADPCWPCFKVLAAAGVKRIVYGEAYARSGHVIEGAAAAGILFERAGHEPGE